ncbi:MAG: hypothetical protein WEF86_03330 [Gemmatimonadota bacterium]
MPRCAFLTMDDLTGFVTYDALARGPLAELGWTLDEVSWRAPDVVWHEYDLVVIRTPWDYQTAPAAFLCVIDSIAAVTRLENDAPTVRWNLRKSYLQQLEERAVRIVPTLWQEDGDEHAVRAAFDTFATDEIVIKPQVGANADDAIWLRRAEPEFDANLRYTANLYRERAHLLQPFVHSIVEEGEFSLIFFRGEYSHGILKTPRRHDFRVQEEHGGTITAVCPEPALLRAAERAVRAAAAVGPSARAPLYARADLVRMPDGGFALMELELIEPSLYLSYDAGAPARFAAAIDDTLRRT